MAYAPPTPTVGNPRSRGRGSSITMTLPSTKVEVCIVGEERPTQSDRVRINGKAFTVALIGGEVYYWHEKGRRWERMPALPASDA